LLKLKKLIAIVTNRGEREQERNNKNQSVPITDVSL
jgi:hypothetical protein